MSTDYQVIYCVKDPHCSAWVNLKKVNLKLIKLRNLLRYFAEACDTNITSQK